MRNIGDKMPEPTKSFEHTRLGKIDPWSNQFNEVARMYAGDEWGSIRDKVAQYRSGAGSALSGSDMPGYAGTDPEGQRLRTWLIESLMYGRPVEDLGATKKTKIYTDPAMQDAINLTGG